MEQKCHVAGVDLNFSNPDFSRILFTLMRPRAKRSPEILELSGIPYPLYSFHDTDTDISVLALSNPYYPLASEEIWDLIREIVTLVHKENVAGRSESRNARVEKERDLATAFNRTVYILETNLNLTSLCISAVSEKIKELLKKTDLYIFHVWSLTPFLAKLRLEPIFGRMRLTSPPDQRVNEKYLRNLADEVKVLHQSLASSALDQHVVNIFTPKFYHVEKTWPTRISDSKSFLTEEQEEILKFLTISPTKITLVDLSEILETVAFNIMKNDAAYLWGAEGMVSELFGELVSYFDSKGHQPSNVILIPHLRLNAHRLSDLMAITTEATREKVLINLRMILNEIMEPLKNHLDVLTFTQQRKERDS